MAPSTDPQQTPRSPSTSRSDTSSTRRVSQRLARHPVPTPSSRSSPQPRDSSPTSSTASSPSPSPRSLPASTTLPPSFTPTPPARPRTARPTLSFGTIVPSSSDRIQKPPYNFTPPLATTSTATPSRPALTLPPTNSAQGTDPPPPLPSPPRPGPSPPTTSSPTSSGSTTSTIRQTPPHLHLQQANRPPTHDQARAPRASLVPRLSTQTVALPSTLIVAPLSTPGTLLVQRPLPQPTTGTPCFLAMADHITQMRADYNAIEHLSDEAALRPLAILSITLARLLIGADVVEEDLEAANAAKEAATRALRDETVDQVTVRQGGTDPTTLWRQQTRVDAARNQGLSKLGANSSDGLDTLVKLMEMWHVSTDPSLFEPKTIPDFPEPLNVLAMFKLKVASGANERARGLLQQLIACNPDWGWADLVAWAESTTITPIQRTNRDIAASISEIPFDWWAKHTAPDGRQSTPAIEFSRTMRNACTDALSSPHSELVASAILDKVDVSLRHLLGPNMARVTNVLDLCKMIESIPRDSYQSHLAQHERIAGLVTRADIRKEMASGSGRATAVDRAHSGTQQQGRSPWVFDGFRSAPDPAPKSHASPPAGLQGSYFTTEDMRKPEHLLGISYSRFDDTTAGRRDFALACMAYMKQNPPTSTKPNSSAFPLTPGTQAPGAFRSCDKCGKGGHISSNCSGSPVNEVERRLRSLVRADSVLSRGPRNAHRTRMVALLAEDDQLDMIDLYETLSQLPSTDNLEDQDFLDA